VTCRAHVDFHILPLHFLTEIGTRGILATTGRHYKWRADAARI
jgi:hypothetical protein